MNLNEIAPCGIDCVNCEMYEKNMRTDIWERAAAMLGKRPEDVRCRGCREQGGCTIHEDCQTLACVQKKGIDFCSDCGEFPCSRLMPMKDRADRAPHNLKAYNLCRLKLLGVEDFLKEAALNRKKYFLGKLIIGAGPQLEEQTPQELK